MNPQIWGLAATFFLLCSSAFSGDVIRLKNGDVYRGDILTQEFGKSVQIKFKDGNEKNIPWTDIAGIDKEEAKPEQVLRVMEAPSDGSGNITGGWVIFGASYGASVVGCAIMCKNTSNLYIPAFGPFMQLGENISGSMKIVAIVSGVAQLTGLTLATIGYMQKSRFRKWQAESKVSLAPVVGPATYGVGLAVRW